MPHLDPFMYFTLFWISSELSYCLNGGLEDLSLACSF